MDVYFKDNGGNRVGYVNGDDIKDNGGNRVGYINGNDIKDNGGNRIGYLNGEDFKDTYGNRVGYINGNDIKDTYGNRVGYVEGNASDIEMCAAGLLLFDLDSDSSDSADSSYSRSTPKKWEKPEDAGEWVGFIIGLFFFALWHFLKGPFVAFSLIKETSARKEWWGTSVRSILLGSLFFVILVMILSAIKMENMGIIIAAVFWLAFTMLPVIAVSIRRMHDIGKKGWWILIPLVNFVMCGFFPSKTENNPYI